MRLDRVLAERGLARSRSQAQELIQAGHVKVNGRLVTRAATIIEPADHLDVQTDPWVSRAAHKLLGALDDLQVDVPRRVLDAGASTGGFTQVLLSRGAQQVYAVDVGHDQLAAELRQDPRVRVREGLNLRDLALADLDDEPVDLVVADVSFISLRLIIAQLVNVTRPSGDLLLMVKPQFEVGRQKLGSGGVVHSAPQRLEAVDAVVASAAAYGWQERGRAQSRLPGPAGNIEFFVHLATNQSSPTPAALSR